MKYSKSYLTISIFTSLFITLFSFDSNAQSWRNYYNTPDSGVCNAICIFSGDVFITGKVRSASGDWDAHVVKIFALFGTQQDTFFISTADSEEPVEIITGPSEQRLYLTTRVTDSAGKVWTGLAKFGIDGKMFWNKKIPTESTVSEEPVSIITHSYRRVLYLLTKITSSGNVSFRTRAIDTSGNVLWTNLFDRSASDIPRKLQIFDNSIYAAGSSLNVSGISELAVLKFDTSGIMVWSKFTGVEGSDVVCTGLSARSFIATAGYYYNGTDYDMITQVYSSSGDSLWQRRLNGSSKGNDFAQEVLIDNLNNVILGGTSYAGQARGNDFSVTKYLQTGDSVWTLLINGRLSGDDSLIAMVVDGFNCIFVTGSAPDLNGDYAYLSSLLNTNGFFHWTNYFQNKNLPGANIPSATAKMVGINTFVITGTTFGATQTAFTTIAFFGVIDGLSGVQNSLPDDLKLFNYPNPFNPETKVSFTLNNSGPVKLSVYDITGRSVGVLIEAPMQRGSHEFRYNADALAAGIYFLELKTQNLRQVRKIVVVK